MNQNIDKEAGLRSQIKQLKERIHSLDMNKVDPSELKSALDSLKDLESRYADIQEKRRVHKEEKAKALAETKVQSTSAPELCGCGHARTDHDSEGGSMLCNICTNDHVFTPAKSAEALAAAPVLDSKPTPAPVPQIDTPPSAMKTEAEDKKEDKPVEKKSEVDTEAAANADVIMAFLEMSNPNAKSQHLFIEQESPKKWNLVNYNTIIATREGDELALNTHKYSVTTSKIQSKIWYEAQAMGLSVVDYQTKEPLELGPKPKVKDVNPDVPPSLQEKPVVPTAEKQATVGKFALDDVVEPIYGSAGSYGRIMRYDADKDMAYVHWDSGKLADAHGFGAYKGSDLRKRASVEKSATVTHREDGWHVLSEEGKNLGGPYKSKEEAVKRLRQVEYFKHHKGSLKEAEHIDPKWLSLADEEIAMGSDIAHEVAIEHGQMYRNVQDMKWFREAVALELQEMHEPNAKQAEGVETLKDWHDTTDPQMADPGEDPNMGYGGDRPGIAVAPKAAIGEPGTGEVLELNVANRKWTAKRTSGAGSPDAWVIFDDKGQQVMAITQTERELTQPELEQIVFKELGNKQLVRATLSCNFAILKKGHKVKIVDLDMRRKEAKFVSEENSITGWATLDKFDFYVVAEERKPHMDVKCAKCGKKVPLSYSDYTLCRDCERKEEQRKKTEAELMPLSKSASSVHLKSAKTLEELIDKCPDCFKKFLKFAAEKGIRITADDLTEHVDRIRTKIEQTKEILQTQTQADDSAPAVETEGATSPKSFAEGDRVVHPNKGEGTVVYVSPEQITVDWDWVGQKILGPEPIPAAKIVNIKKIKPAPADGAVEKHADDINNPPTQVLPVDQKWMWNEQQHKWVITTVQM